MSRPEEQAPADIYYGDSEAKKYTSSSRNQQIQSEMTHRALELMAIPPDQTLFLMDIGCGSGLSGEILEELGHIWVGLDIAPSMLEVALERQVEGDLFLQDIGQGMGFRPGSFDGAIRTMHSISVLQWLFTSATSSPLDSPPARLTRFFTALYACLRNPSRAVLQFYPETDDQIQLITSIARRAGFGGGIVVDYPNSKKARKVFLVLMVGSGRYASSGSGPNRMEVDGEENGMPRALEDGDDAEGKVEARRVAFERRREKASKIKVRKGQKPPKDRDWVLKKKELYRQRGKEDVPHNSKYTGRKRRPVF